MKENAKGKKAIENFAPVVLAEGQYELMAYRGPADGQTHGCMISAEAADPKNYEHHRTECIAFLGDGTEPGPMVVRGTYRPAWRSGLRGHQGLCLLYVEKDSV